MAISRIKIDTNMLNKDIQSIEACLKDIKKAMTEMKSEVAELDSMWDGDANKEFNKAFRDDMQVLNDAYKEIKEIVAYEKNARKQYNSCETKVGALVDSITV